METRRWGKARGFPDVFVREYGGYWIVEQKKSQNDTCTPKKKEASKFKIN